MENHMTTMLNDLISQKAAIDQQISEARKEKHLAAIDSIKSIVKEHGLLATDIFPKFKPTARTKGASKTKGKSLGKVAPKYKDPVSGKTWTGRGISPAWIAGKDRAQFVI